jgi:hypothetical protein
VHTNRTFSDTITITAILDAFALNQVMMQNKYSHHDYITKNCFYLDENISDENI